MNESSSLSSSSPPFSIVIESDDEDVVLPMGRRIVPPTPFPNLSNLSSPNSPLLNEKNHSVFDYMP